MPVVSTGLNSTVNSQSLFSSIVTAIKDVEEQAKTSSSQRQSIKDIRQKAKADGPTAITSSRQIPLNARLEFSGAKNAAAAEATAIPAQNTGAKPRSKFSKRFNMTGSGMSQADASGLAVRSQLGTPSTSAASTQATSPPDNRGSAIQEVKGDTNQWIKRPKGLGILGQQIIDSGERVEDPVDLHSKLGEREFSILQEYMNMWTRSIGELLQKLRETVPKEGMIGEVHYWRDLARVLEAISQELK